MKSTQKLTLDREDIKAAILFWVTDYHGLCYDEGTGDKVVVPHTMRDVVVTLKDEMS